MIETLYQACNNLVNFVNREEVVTTLFNNRFYTILAVVVLMRCKYAVYRSMWLCALCNIPGTILHELMHFLVGLFLNARPINLNILPKKDLLSGGYVLGSVSFKNITFYNAVPAGLAPLLLLPIAFYLNRYMLPFVPYSFCGYLAYILLQTIIIENAIPSRADIKIAGMYLSGIVIYGSMLIALLLML